MPHGRGLRWNVAILYLRSAIILTPREEPSHIEQGGAQPDAQSWLSTSRMFRILRAWTPQPAPQHAGEAPFTELAAVAIPHPRGSQPSTNQGSGRGGVYPGPAYPLCAGPPRLAQSPLASG